MSRTGEVWQAKKQPYHCHFNLTTMLNVTNSRNFGLDLFRALAILQVVLGHSQFWLIGTPLQGFPFFRTTDGVDMFFVLSGFLIGGILLKDLEITPVFSTQSLFTFWKRRWFRTLPNYYLILIINYLMVKSGIIYGDPTQFNWTFFLFLQNFSTPFHGFFWESWSLAVEEWFYLFFPLVMVIFLRQLSPKTAYLVAVSVLILFPLAYRLSIYSPTMSDQDFDFALRKIVLTRLDSIGYGLLAAYFYRCHRPLWENWKWPCFLLGAVGMAVLLNRHPSLNSYYAQVFFFMLISIAIMLWLPLATSLKAVPGLFGKAITHISKISYSMYLLNLGVIMAIMQRHFPPTDQLDRYGKFALYWGLVIGLSTLLYRYFERPMMNLRDRF
ncbi:MAG: acyltransferase [Saprospiraceae bacterium]|nr:acyltransferase [Saprospiraceae bacterium]